MVVVQTVKVVHRKRLMDQPVLCSAPHCAHLTAINIRQNTDEINSIKPSRGKNIHVHAVNNIKTTLKSYYYCIIFNHSLYAEHFSLLNCCVKTEFPPWGVNKGTSNLILEGSYGDVPQICSHVALML